MEVRDVLTKPRTIGPGDWVTEAALMEDEDLATLPVPDPKILTALQWPEDQELPAVYRKAYRRALVALARRDALRAPNRHATPTKQTRRLHAQAVAAYALWHVTPRYERKARGWPTRESELFSMIGYRDGYMRALLYDCRFNRWIDRYDEREPEGRRTRNVDDILYSKILEQEHLAPKDVNQKLFETYYRREGKLVHREANKTLNVHVHASKEDNALLVERVTKALPYVTESPDERAGDQGPDRPQVADRTPVEERPRPSLDEPERVREQEGSGGRLRPPPDQESVDRGARLYRPPGGRLHSRLGVREAEAGEGEDDGR